MLYHLISNYVNDRCKATHHHRHFLASTQYTLSGITPEPSRQYTMPMETLDHISKPFKMKNTIQTYAWGSHTAVTDLFGIPNPSAKPQAELWMGAHPKAPSMIWLQGRWQALDLLISQYFETFLGKTVANRFGPQLPFLLKILAAEQPLSIQAHPDKIQAAAGFRRENKAEIDLTAPHRNYKDPQHKPECLCALTPFTGLCGFRSLSNMMPLMGKIWPTQYNNLLTSLTKDGMKSFFKRLMTLPVKKRLDLVAQNVHQAHSAVEENAAFSWMVRLNAMFPGDIGVLAPLFLNLVELQPGEAIFLPARQLHAYLNGVGIEIMANSDNVLRGGLTHKHVDVPELIRVLDFEPHTPEILMATERDSIENAYPSSAEEFVLSVLQISSDRDYAFNSESICILFCTRGSAVLSCRKDESIIPIQRGESVLIPAALSGWSISGRATLYMASVNMRSFR